MPVRPWCGAPLSLWAFSGALTRYRLGWRGVIATVVAGILLHAILLGSLKAYLSGAIGLDLLIVIQVVNALLPAPVVLLLGGEAVRHGRRKHAGGPHFH